MIASSPVSLQEVKRLVLQHLVGLQHVENGLRLKAERMISAALQDITHELQTRYKDLTPFQQKRLRDLQVRLHGTIGERYQRYAKDLDSAMEHLGRIESRYAETVLQATVATTGVEIATTALPLSRIKAIAQLPVDGALPAEWWKRAADNLSFTARRQIQIGLMRGEGTGEIVRRLSPAGVPGAMARTSARMMVRTTITHVSAQANLETFEAQNEEVTDSYQYVATLDDRTSIICATLDGQVFRYDDPKAPRPPQHPNCRSTVVPVVNWAKLGVMRPPEELTPITRASMGGPTSYRTYQSWLRDQPAEVQDSMLGAARGKLFRAGEASLKDLLARDGTVLTLDQLEKKLEL